MKINFTAERLHLITYRAMLDVPRELVSHVATLLAAHRRARGTRRGVRELTCWLQAVFVMVWFRDAPADHLDRQGIRHLPSDRLPVPA